MSWSLPNRPTVRLPVRDPLAGILMDWFGIQSGTARVLLALYRARSPIRHEALSAAAGVAPGCVPAYCARLRGAGFALSSNKGRHHVGYSLSEADRDQIREGFAHARGLLSQESLSAAEERIEALEDALGMTFEPPPEYGLTRGEATIFGMIRKTNPISRDRIFVALYGHLDDPPTAKTIDVMVCKMRPKLARHGIRIVGHRGGYEMLTDAIVTSPRNVATLAMARGVPSQPLLTGSP